MFHHSNIHSNGHQAAGNFDHMNKLFDFLEDKFDFLVNKYRLKLMMALGKLKHKHVAALRIALFSGTALFWAICPHQLLRYIHPSEFVFAFSCIFILLSRKSDQCAMQAGLGVASHLSTTHRWEIAISVVLKGTTSLTGLFFTMSF